MTGARGRALLAALAALAFAPGCVTALVLGIPKAGAPTDVTGLEAASVSSGVLVLRVRHEDGDVRLLRWRPDRDREQVAGPGEVEALEDAPPGTGVAVVTSHGDGPLPAGLTWTRYRGRLWEDGRCTDDVWLARDAEVSGGRILGTVLLVPLSVAVDAVTWPFQLVFVLLIL